MENLISADQIDSEFRDIIFNLAAACENGDAFEVKGKTIATVFLEPSTRTRLSFESAAHKLGINVLSVSDSKNTSGAKGESLEDTIRTISCYCDLIVLRHPSPDSAQRAASVSTVPVINAGSGGEEHPTQALLDLYYILKHTETPSEANILLFGDPDDARTIKSLKTVLRPITDNIEEMSFFDKRDSAEWGLLQNWADIIYMTRIQSERKTEICQKVRHNLDFNEIRQDAIIMHPLPRLDELPDIKDDRIKIWDQAKCGLYVRMALFLYFLSSK